MASIVTPFVASPGTDRVSRSNPGPGSSCVPEMALGDRGGDSRHGGNALQIRTHSRWIKRRRNRACGISHKFSQKWGILNRIGIVGGVNRSRSGRGGSGGSGGGASPANSPRGGSGDYGCGLWPWNVYKGFVMSASVEVEALKENVVSLV